eukprot:1160699-Pelagomonas_calceolata.AAC.6
MLQRLNIKVHAHAPTVGHRHGDLQNLLLQQTFLVMLSVGGTGLTERHDPEYTARDAVSTVCKWEGNGQKSLRVFGSRRACLGNSCQAAAHVPCTHISSLPMRKLTGIRLGSSVGSNERTTRRKCALTAGLGE